MVEETIYFKIVSNKNENVYTEGFVNINDEEAVDVDWHYWTGNGYQYSPFYHHDQEEITGLTDQQNAEIDEFINDYRDDALWIDTCILQCSDEDDLTYIRENCTLIINDGAKMKCEIVEHPEIDSYIVEVIPRFNNQEIDIAAYMAEMNMNFDPWNVNDGRSYVENGKIFFEMSKDYWDENAEEELIEELIEDVIEEARRIYAMSLTREMGIYSRYGEVMEQSMDGCYDDEWLFKMTQHQNDSEEDLDMFLKEEGLIDEEMI